MSPLHRRWQSPVTRMKLVAGLLLLLAALLYVIATAMEPRHPAWGYLASFAEAAMVGAIADWFAVTALFRHPLGLPIPHTAIIPRSRLNSARLAHDDQPHYQQRLGREHEQIYDAIARQDAESARAAMRLHLTNSRERLRQAHEEAETDKVS